MGSKYILGWGLGGVKTANEAPGSTGPEAPCFPRERLEAETSGELSRQQGGVGCRAQTLVTLRQSRLHLLGGGRWAVPHSCAIAHVGHHQWMSSAGHFFSL